MVLTVVAIWGLATVGRAVFYGLERLRHPEIIAPMWADLTVAAAVAPLVVFGCFLTLRAWRAGGAWPAVALALATMIVFGASVRPLHATVLATFTGHEGATAWLAGFFAGSREAWQAWLATTIEYGGMYLSAVGGAVGFLSFRELMNERLLRAQFQARAVQERLRTLRAQQNPHFLFNVLNSIVGATHAQASAIRPLILRLSELLRRTLEASEHDENSLRDEIAIVESYLTIEQIRRPNRIDWSAQIGAGCERAIVPSLLLLPLVENAVKHGLRGGSERVSIAVEVTRCEERLQVCITNTCPTCTRPASGDGSHAGFGLRNLQEQLTFQYGSDAVLIAHRNDSEAFEVRVMLPFSSQGHGP